jgi:hypothetical protein
MSGLTTSTGSNSRWSSDLIARERHRAGQASPEFQSTARGERAGMMDAKLTVLGPTPELDLNNDFWPRPDGVPVLPNILRGSLGAQTKHRARLEHVQRCSPFRIQLWNSCCSTIPIASNPELPTSIPSRSRPYADCLVVGSAPMLNVRKLKCTAIPGATCPAVLRFG